MGLLDALLGRRKVKGPAPDRLFALTTAAVTLESAADVRTSGKAAIVFQPLATGDFGQIVSEMEELVAATGKDTGTTLRNADDEYGYRWMVLEDGDLDDLVVGVNAVSDALQVGGYGDRVLAAVFGFTQPRGGPLYFFYNYKSGRWWPFVPATGGARTRDNERELQLQALMTGELPIEPDLSRWLALWGIPI